MSSINRIIKDIIKFRDERDWKQFHDPKNMAISIILEASELLEHFQWKTETEVEKYISENKEDVKEEIADIAIYLFELADNLEIDIISAMQRKLRKNSQKYPVEKARGKHTKYTRL